MVENGNAGGGGGGGTQAPARAGAPPRPTLILPPRSSLSSLFQGGGGAGGGAAGASPGPLSLVSSFFAEDPDSDCRSFTQLLAGAMNSPVAAAAATTRWSTGAQEKEGVGGSAAAESGGSGMARLGQNRPPSLAVCQPQLFTVPPGLSPTSLLDSPAFFSSGLGNFGMSHQEVLAQVTAQAALSPFRMPSPMEFPSPLFTATTTSSTQQPTQEPPTLQSNNTTFEAAEEPQSDQISQPAGIIVDKPADDGYNWRKYGQKMVKGSEYPRSYYKCTHPNCPVKKKLERSEDGQVTEIIYKGQHNHPRPTPNKRSKEGSNMPSGSNDINGNHGNPSTSETGPSHQGNLRKTNLTTSAAVLSQRAQELDYGTPEQLSGSSDGEEVGEMKADEGGEREPDHKRRNISASSQKTLTEPRIIVQTNSEVDLLDDGYRWRKYGQKVVKGNPNPRSYYKCTFAGCNVRKHIERSSTDSKAVITTYEGKHNHDVPAARNSSHNIVGAVLAPRAIRPNQNSLRSANFNNSDRPVGILQLKEEHEIT